MTLFFGCDKLSFNGITVNCPSCFSPISPLIPIMSSSENRFTYVNLNFLLNLGSTDVHARKSHKGDPDYRKLRRALCVGYGNQLAERMLHHNGYHTVGYRTQLVQVCCVISLSDLAYCNVRAAQKLRVE